MGGMMRMINATWPHEGHMFLNLGRAGVGMESLAHHWCAEGLLPRGVAVDLLLVGMHEHRSGDGRPPGAAGLQHYNPHLEALHHQLRHVLAGGPRRPLPVLVLAFCGSLAPSQGQADFQDGEDCLRDHGCVEAAPGRPGGRGCVDGPGPGNFSARLGFAEEEGAYASDVHRPLLDHYGWAEVSPAAVVRSALRDGAPAALGLSTCAFVASFYRDRIHPSESGQLFVADLLMAHLSAAQAALGAEPSAGPQLAALAFPPAAFTCVFAMGRVIGWIAHAREQAAGGRIVRPQSRYVGPAPKMAA